MRHSPTCRWCGAVAVFRFAQLTSPQARPGNELRDRPRFACLQHFPDMVAGLAGAPGGGIAVLAVEMLEALAAADETRPMQPIRETVRRRPPAVGIEELKGAALLRALADELERDPELDGEQL